MDIRIGFFIFSIKIDKRTPHCYPITPLLPDHPAVTRSPRCYPITPMQHGLSDSEYYKRIRQRVSSLSYAQEKSIVIVLMSIVLVLANSARYGPILLQIIIKGKGKNARYGKTVRKHVLGEADTPSSWEETYPVNSAGLEVLYTRLDKRLGYFRGKINRRQDELAAFYEVVEVLCQILESPDGYSGVILLVENYRFSGDVFVTTD